MKLRIPFIALAFTLILSSFSSAQTLDNTVNERDLEIDIKKRSNFNRKDGGNIKATTFHIVVEGRKRNVDIESLTVSYEIFYYIDNNDLAKGGKYTSKKGFFNPSETNGSEDKPFVTEAINIHDTVRIERNNRGRRGRNNNNNTNNNRNDRRVTGVREDEMIGVLVDITQNGKIIATLSDNTRILKRALALRKENKPITAQSFK